MMTQYPPLPLPPNAHVGEPVQHYGMRLLAFVMDHNLTATLSDEELQLAIYVVGGAMWGKGKDGTDLIVVERIRAAEKLIAIAIRARAKLTEQTAQAIRPQSTPVDEGGFLASLRPQPAIGPTPNDNHAQPQTVQDSLRQWMDKAYASNGRKPGDDIKF